MDAILDPAECADRVRRAVTPQQTIETMRDLDITLDDLQIVTDADERTIRRWAEGNKPREPYRDALDRLRTAVLYILLRGAMEPTDIAHWLRSRSFDLGPDPEYVARRPLDALRDNQLADVIVAVNALLHPPSLTVADDVADRLRAHAEAVAEQYAKAKPRARGRRQRNDVRNGTHVADAPPKEELDERAGNTSDELNGEREVARSEQLLPR